MNKKLVIVGIMGCFLAFGAIFFFFESINTTLKLATKFAATFMLPIL